MTITIIVTITNKMTSFAILVQLYYVQDLSTESFLTRKNVINVDLKTETQDFVMLKTSKTFHSWLAMTSSVHCTQTNDFNINED